MFKAFALAALFASAVVAPAAAQSFDPNYAAGPQGGGNWDNGGRGGPGWDGNRGPGRPQGDFRGPDRYDTLPPWQLTRILRHQGFFGADILNRRGEVFIVRAASRGRDFILVVDSRSGNVLRARPAGPSWNGGNGWGQDWRRW